ncbi:polysaccharide deacetylase family protein [Deminuibacter soli]|uniref:DUF3473 domain-containing protein n=1 Tax=Deminuibacter soli TaxID=2291815 RepID=A0A3E1NR97_9BACT|nr:polysaccharide deacetylase family protein [Deminuibacter soli]RFM30443.1 DUF3473 domain-containing protein [Deminuibacter soli]
MSRNRSILLSFDVEEFDMPLEYNQPVPMDQQLEVGYKGLRDTMEVIDATGATSTFFTTAHFANSFPDAVRRIAQQHEIASHTFYHSSFEVPHLLQSRLQLEAITGNSVTGLRMPRMRYVAMPDVIAAGYTYDSSVNPTWLPGRYDNRDKPRTMYCEEGMLRLPAAVSPRMRIPLFWLAFKNMPYSLFKSLAIRTLKQDGYLCLYFHPWEFTSLDGYHIPGYTKRWAGEPLKQRLYKLIADLGKEGDFVTIQQMLAQRRQPAL